MVKYIPRSIERQITELVSFFPAVGLIGARQVGKTTLVKALGKEFAYLDLEDERDRAKLYADPFFYFNENRNRCVILDEVQQMPEIFRLLRGIIDEDRRPGRFILLGSASPELLRQSSESLAGRIAYLELTPFNLLEIEQDYDWKRLWLQGGFPNSFLAPSDKLSFEWRRNFIRSYIERDLPSLGLRADPVLVRRFWQMLNGENGGIWLAEKYARSLGVSGHTVKSYLSFLENAFLVFTLQPWFANVSKRVIKSPKVFQFDSGLLHFWLDLQSIDDLLGSVHLGNSWEAFVIAQIKGIAGDQLNYYFYRTYQGAECDLVLARGNKPLTGIEIKFSSAPVPAKGFYIATEDLGTNENFIIVPETEDYSLRSNLKVVGLLSFLKYHLPKLIQ
ncbi:MAG TPA: ATP-binding protein [Flavilitoribacter sp.]|nr:ATP-binding protein [Flavilitoribacter sp.]HMQ91033.1 ATP-binding protein [Flavilitoribacter sp.]